jgi:predicted O-linked N-acetylglucosamine transferase (SPINDLY family)
VLVVIRGHYQEHTDALLARLGPRLGPNRDRLLLLEPMSQTRFLQLLQVADVCLDTPHFNGMNSSLEALSMGTPVVTWPSGLQRGRHTYAMYRAMNCLDCVARDLSDYVDIAVRIGSDPNLRQALRARILQNHEVLYENRDVVRGFERFFLSVVAGGAPTH